MTQQFSPVDFHVDSDIRLARTLPSQAFTDENFLDLELATIFARSWLLVPPRESLATLQEKGGHVPFSLLGKPLFLQRDLEGGLHCFPNVCTHAWHPLVENPGQSRSIVCPQHGRRFDCNGKFLSHAGFETLPDFPSKTDHLEGLRVAQWDSLCFVALSNPTAPLSDAMSEVRSSMAKISIGKMKRAGDRVESRELEGNWKQHAWNYMDNYHIRFVHKGPEGLAGAIDLSSYHTELYNLSSLQWVYARKPEDGFDPSLLSPRFRDSHHSERRVFALWWFIFPNLTLNFYPWGLSINVYMPVPGKPNKTQFLWYHFVMDERKYELKDRVYLDQQVDEEDIEAIANVNHGAQSGLAPRGRFAPKEEAGPHWLHRLVYQNVFEAGTTE